MSQGKNTNVNCVCCHQAPQHPVMQRDALCFEHWNDMKYMPPQLPIFSRSGYDATNTPSIQCIKAKKMMGSSIKEGYPVFTLRDRKLTPQINWGECHNLDLM